jgi:hypothetical protein
MTLNWQLIRACLIGCLIQGSLGCTADKACDSTHYDSALPPETTTWQQVESGFSHACGLDSMGRVDCWGFNEFGQADAPDERFESIDAGMHHSCGVTVDGEVLCWGFDAFGQATPPAGRFESVSTGGYQSCGVAQSKEIICWGGIRDGEADPPPGAFGTVSAGEGHTCGVRSNGELACWGLNDSGQASPPAGQFDQVTSGWTHSCGLESDGAVQCWGENTAGQTSPPAARFADLSASRFFTCGIDDEQAAACWGVDTAGQSKAPEGSFSQISAGGEHACALRSAGEIECWGEPLKGDASPIPQAGFSVAGVAWNYGQFDWAKEGRCIHVTDPTPVLYGGLPLVLSSAKIAAGGAFRVNNVETVAEWGLFLTVDDCDESSTGVRTATGVGYSHYENLGPGDTLGNQLVLIVDDATVSKFDEDLRLIGYTGDPLTTTGAIMGFVVGEEGDPLGGATVFCKDSPSGCAPVYYMDTDSSDGLFGSGSVPNNATEAAAEALFLIPNAPVANYSATLAEFSFASILFGHTESVISVLQFVGRKASF